MHAVLGICGADGGWAHIDRPPFFKRHGNRGAAGVFAVSMDVQNAHLSKSVAKGTGIVHRDEHV